MTCDLYRLRIHPVCKHSHTLRRWGSGLWGHRSAQSSLSRTRLTVASATLSGFAPKQSSTHARSAWARTDPRGQAHAWGRGQAGPKAAVRCPCPGGSSPSQRGRQWGEGALLPEGTEGGTKDTWVRAGGGCPRVHTPWGSTLRGSGPVKGHGCAAARSHRLTSDTVRVANTTVGKPAPAWRARQPRPQRPVWPPIPVRHPPAPDALPSHRGPLACFSSVLGRLRGGVGAPWGPGWASGQHADFGAPGLSDRVGGGDSAVRAACSDRLASGSRRPHPQVERGSMLADRRGRAGLRLQAGPPPALACRSAGMRLTLQQPEGAGAGTQTPGASWASPCGLPRGGPRESLLPPHWGPLQAPLSVHPGQAVYRPRGLGIGLSPAESKTSGFPED